MDGRVRLEAARAGDGQQADPMAAAHQLGFTWTMTVETPFRVGR